MIYYLFVFLHCTVPHCLIDTVGGQKAKDQKQIENQPLCNFSCLHIWVPPGPQCLLRCTLHRQSFTFTFVVCRMVGIHRWEFVHNIHGSCFRPRGFSSISEEWPAMQHFEHSKHMIIQDNQNWYRIAPTGDNNGLLSALNLKQLKFLLSKTSKPSTQTPTYM